MTTTRRRAFALLLPLVTTLAACGGGTEPTPSLSLTPPADTVNVGATITLTATLVDGEGLPTPTFSSLDPTLATVDGGGVVTGVKIGRARIVAMSGALRDTATVTVGRIPTFTIDTSMFGGTRYYGVAVNAPGGFAFANRPDNGVVAKYDLLARTLTLSAAVVGSQATGLSFNPAGTRAWVASQLSSRVDRLDALAPSSLGSTALTFNPYWTVTSPDGAKVYVSGNSNILAILNGTTGAFTDSIAVSSTPFGLAMTPSGATLFVGHLGGGTIARITTSTKAATVFKTVGSSTNGLAVSPAGTELAVASENADSLYFFDVSTGANVGQVAINAPWGVAYTGSGAELWVTALTGKVYRVNAATHTLTDSLNIGGTPRGIAIHPLGWGAVVGSEDGTLTVIR